MSPLVAGKIALSGLDGGNLLGYLAALGTLRVLSRRRGDPARMSWSDQNGRWLPVLRDARFATPDEMLDALTERVCGEQTINPAWEMGEDLTISATEFGEQAERAAHEGKESRGWADFLVAFGCEACADEKKSLIEDTEWRTMSGAGHQHFLGFMKDLARNTQREHLERTLLRIWDYLDEKMSLRWDPNDYRPHALRALNPAKDTIRTMHGANRLAVEALPLFPTMPQAKRLRTTGFDREKRVTWPIWEDPLDVNTVSSLLAIRELSGEHRRRKTRDTVTPQAELNLDDRKALRARGIVQVFRARRFTDGKYRNFSPARELI